MAWPWTDTARLRRGPQLQPSSDHLQVDLGMDVLNDDSANQPGGLVTCRSSDQGAGQKQLAATHDCRVASWIATGNAPGMDDLE